MLRHFVQRDANVAVLEHPKWDHCVVIECTSAFSKSATEIPSGPVRQESLGAAARSYHIRVEERAKALPPRISKVRHAEAEKVAFQAVFGIYELLSGPYIALIRTADTVFSRQLSLPPLAPAGAEEQTVEFRRATRIAILPLFRAGRDLPPSLKADENRYLDLLYSAFSSHVFYFSYKHDVTASFQRRAFRYAGQGRHVKAQRWRRADNRFFWNRKAIQPLIDAGLGDQWVVPVMSAHIEGVDGLRVPGSGAEEHRFTYLFISRRSKCRAGTRFCRRGVDAKGNAANEVETEQVLLHQDGSIQSFVQLRGSIPLLWRSPVNLKYAPKVEIEKDGSANAGAFKEHMIKLAETYCGFHLTASGVPIYSDRVVKSLPTLPTPIIHAPVIRASNSRSHRGSLKGVHAANTPPARSRKNSIPRMGTHTPPNEAEVQPGRPSEQAPPPAEGWQGKIVMVNLIDHKGVQQRLGEAFSDLVDAAVHSLAGRAVLPPLRYIWFDFHKECSHMQWSRLSNLLEKLVEDVARGGWFHQGGEACKFSILRVQKGIVRTNCMDNLDRTNVVQSLIARHVLLQCLEERDSIGRQPSGGNGHTADHRHAAPYTTKAGVGGKNVLDSGIPVLEKAFKAIWGEKRRALDGAASRSVRC